MSSTSTTTATTDDASYCHWIARRAVARAALHLGIEHMTEEALTVLASCLLDHISRVGSLTAATAEASGRSSSHCNVLDVIQAVEMCTSSAVGVATPDAAEEHRSDTTGAQTKPPAYPAESYKSLASFCFGPNWHQEDTTNNSRQQDSRRRRANAKGLGGSAATGGWNVPFPEEVPPFPLRKVAKRPMMESLHVSVPEEGAAKAPAASSPTGEKKEDDTEALQDAFWGSLESSDTSAVQEDTAASKEPPTKKQKRQNLDLFLPAFYPPIPRNVLRVELPTETAKARSVTDVSAVRQALAFPPVPARRPEDEDSEAKTAFASMDKPSSKRASQILEGYLERR